MLAKLRDCLLCLALPMLAMGSVRPAFAQAPAPHTFTVQGHAFLMDGKPYQVIAGDMHYVRVPREYWRDRLHKMKAMGLNTLTTYAFWNVHEPRPGVFDFTGQNDLVQYLHDAQAEGLNVILRPGPYVCAEWELGGYPSWLLKNPTLLLRSNDPRYRAAVKTWFNRLGQEIKPLLAANGGPIIAIQVENEYGAFGDDKVYLEDVKTDLIQAGLGDTLLFTSNQPNDTLKGSLPELPTVINFGTGDAEKAFTTLDRLRPDGPRMTGEYWAGWFDKWGESHHETDGKKEAAEFRWMLEHGYSVSLYMFHGGTSFGWMNGADSHTGTDYHPDTTSYDYDAPLDEAGNPRYKYALFQQIIADVTHTPPQPLPTPAPSAAYPVGPTMLSASLWDNLPKPILSAHPLTFEDLDQSFGYVLYRTTLPPGDGSTLRLPGMHDYAQVYLDRKLLATLDRRLDQDTLQLPPRTRRSTLDILVENTGRVNYSHAIRTERTGLTGGTILAGKPLAGWNIFSLPMDDLSHLHLRPQPCTGPCFYQVSLLVDNPADTWLDTRGLHKGQLWLGPHGEHNLGRFWSIGPQYALYTPGPWLRTGTTPVLFFDLTGDPSEHLLSVKDPIFGASKSTRENQ